MNIRTIAKKSGVSVATVSRVINRSALVHPETRDKVMNIIETADFKPRMGKRRNFTVGVTVPSVNAAQLDHGYTCEFIAGIAEAVSGFGASMRIVDINDLVLMPEKSGTYNDYCREKGINGLIHMLVPTMFHSVLDRIADDGIRQVVVEHRFERSDISWIDVDNFGTSRLLAQNLAQLKAKSFAIITAERQFKAHFDRHHGFLDGIKSLNLTIPPYWDIERREISVEAGSAATLSMLASSPEVPRVIYYTNVELALGGMKTLLARGLRLPQDVVVAFFDDSNFADWFPNPVAYLRLSAYEIGLKAGSFCVTPSEKFHQEILTPELFVGPELMQSLA